MKVFRSVSRHDMCEVVLEGLPRSPVEDCDVSWDSWIVDAVMELKRKVLMRDAVSESVFKDGDLVKAAIVGEMMKAGLSRDERKRLGALWNKSLGANRNTKDWPDNVVWAVKSFDGMPKVNQDILCRGWKPSEYASSIIASIYIAGSFDSTFMFATQRYSKLIGCSHQAIKWQLDKLSDQTYKGRKGTCQVGLGVLKTICGNRPIGARSACKWYSIADKELLLDILGFDNLEERKRFVLHVQSMSTFIPQRDWSQYMITYDWLKENRLLRMTPVRGLNSSLKHGV